MRCIICIGPEIKLQQVDEIIKFGSDIMLITLNLQVCTQCGERYYSRAGGHESDRVNEG